MNTKHTHARAHVVLSEDLLKDIDAFVGARQRGAFSAMAAEKELMRHRQIEALKASAGAWKDRDHVELKGGSAQWVRKIRGESERRFKRVTAAR
jgi:hypothetical protein